jgi:MFS transporter, NNP family, nitrate/nitrite transporter
MSTADVGNSNIAALTGTLLVRFLAGPACDKWGPRWTYIGILFAGALPTAMAGLVRNTSGLIAVRFFAGVLGGTFVPCQVWSTGFFDKNVVGSANALIGGWGNAGGGITYFLMPLIYDSLKEDMGLSSRKAWRVTFIVPFILITATALGMLFLCPDTPTGRWQERHNATKHLLASHGIETSVLNAGSQRVDASKAMEESGHSSGTTTPVRDEKKVDGAPATQSDVERGSVHGGPAPSIGKEVRMTPEEMIATARGEIVVAPTFKEACDVFFSLQTAFHACTYICSFGGELAINSYLASYYLRNFPYLGQTNAGRWASMFGLLNVVTRPLGGIISDLLYAKTRSLWAKKGWILFVGIISGAFNIAIGLTDPRNENMMFGLVAGMAFFLEAGNGANFGLVPHVHPHANGLISGFTGAAGNLGGVIFAILFRFHGSDYQESFWILGIMVIGFNLVFAWVRPIPKGQIGGR